MGSLPSNHLLSIWNVLKPQLGSWRLFLGSIVKTKHQSLTSLTFMQMSLVPTKWSAIFALCSAIISFLFDSKVVKIAICFKFIFKQ